MLNSDKNEIELNKIKTSENIHQMVVTEDTEVLINNLFLNLQNINMKMNNFILDYT